MARIRSIHPSFFTDDAVLSCSLPARMLFVGLWTEADCQGVFEWRPVQLKVRILPIDPVDVPALLAELIEARLVTEFTAGGHRYGAIKDFRQYQRPKNPTAMYPLPDAMRVYVGIDKPPPGNAPDDGPDFPQRPGAEVHPFPQKDAVRSDDYPQRGENLRMEGREGEGVRGEEGGVGETKSPRKRGSRLPEDWQPDAELVAYGVSLGFTHRQVLDAAERFRLHFHSSAKPNAVKVDWGKAFQGWLRDNLDRRGAGVGPPGRPAAYGPRPI